LKVAAPPETKLKFPLAVTAPNVMVSASDRVIAPPELTTTVPKLFGVPPVLRLIAWPDPAAKVVVPPIVNTPVDCCMLVFELMVKAPLCVVILADKTTAPPVPVAFKITFRLLPALLVMAWPIVMVPPAGPVVPAFMVNVALAPPVMEIGAVIVIFPF